MELLDGKLASAKLKKQIKIEVQEWVSSGGKKPHLAAILVGEDGASKTYVESKVRSCDEVGFSSTLVKLPETATEQQVVEAIEKLNNDEDVDGFIVQLPLPSHINEEKVTTLIDPKKDVDGFHPVNVGRMALGQPAYVSATPYGITQMLEMYDIDTVGKHCVVVGRSNIVGSPMSILMAKNNKYANCTVTLCHSRTKDLKNFCLSADILIVALGKAEFVTADMVKEGAVVIDVGITRVEDTSRARGYRVAGDVNFKDVAPKCSYITPVPGGVGLMTVASLIKNTMLATKKEIYGE
ncbi:MAG: methylenetetrahydrofolate dehydrogenase (NADP+)/methenyltetrahydrofolate cyclohydrolase [Glaciecola sp.]|jgi:methylenetetrahydrofolate dehydrogenase (NADP+)/methenyltetrahydrofolate cyclohydrolase